jgi:hypothetical protein
MHMHILRIEHPVPSFDGWKKAFDSDPLNRQQSGVRRYRIYRPAGDPNHVGVDLEFDSSADAEAMLSRLGELWSGVQGKIMDNPRAQLIEVIESVQY